MEWESAAGDVWADPLFSFLCVDDGWAGDLAVPSSDGYFSTCAACNLCGYACAQCVAADESLPGDLSLRIADECTPTVCLRVLCDAVPCWAVRSCIYLRASLYAASLSRVAGGDHANLCRPSPTKIF